MWCRDKKVKIEVKQPPSAFELPDRIVRKDPVFAFVIGHTETSQGAVNYLGETEWSFNRRIARKAQLKLADKNFPSVIIFRPENKSYKSQATYVAERAHELGVEFSFCLHFNSYLQPAYGCEVLVTNEANKETITVADFITDQLNDRFNITERHEDGIKTIYKGHNGHLMLHQLESIGSSSCLIEPCFANHRTIESQTFFENEDMYASILADAAWLLLR